MDVKESQKLHLQEAFNFATIAATIKKRGSSLKK
jgi:hypothetical protein